ncbi:hypothetical protein SAMN05877753_11125 [Bacillus oleivorans]|uniref:Uncharacterized protein n=1 Tax=Bacillus oleivorans TaxID=1448271 RepID=A0A285D5P6_9BACI|nr:hypothetical protein [Bacillus oleivorans]SNX75137.1 hypothetical protein SAMN05877753_11125 [Bacillus oleivorans]
MATLAKLISIGIIAISFLLGSLAFYWISSLDRKEKKAKLEEVVSFLINFTIFIWIGKIIVNLSDFIKDPLAILAYPSDSSSFYMAVLLSEFYVYFRMSKNVLQLSDFLRVLFQVILTASFVFEFIYFVQDRNEYSLSNMIFSALLLGIYYVAEKRTDFQLFTIILFSWMIGAVILITTQPYLSFFGYLLSLQFIVVFFFVNLGVLIFNRLKR